MKSFASLVALFSAFAAAQTGSVAISEFFVDKHEDPLTLVIRVHSVSFTLNGFDADNLRCELTNPPTFPTDILRCNDVETSYRMVIAPGTEGSGIQFGVGLYYDDDAESVHVQGWSDVPTYCTLNEEDHDWREFRYTCNQLVPTEKLHTLRVDAGEPFVDVGSSICDQGEGLVVVG